MRQVTQQTETETEIHTYVYVYRVYIDIYRALYMELSLASYRQGEAAHKKALKVIGHSP